MHTPTRRALLIGSPRNGLPSAVPSVRRMAEFLLGKPDPAAHPTIAARRSFAEADVRCIAGDGATRAAIVAAFADLLEATGPGDTVVVYWAGHGGLFPDSPAPDIVARTWFQPHPVLEPMDIADSDERHFNGLLGGEVRLLLRGLARLCDNVTAIFDCCHASGLTEVDRPAADTSDADDRAAIMKIAERAGERIARRRSQRPDEVHRSGDPRTAGIVRLVASSGSERAYADPTTGRLHFTDALVDALADPSLADLAWDPLVRLVRARVQAVRPEQRPGVEGAASRLPFTTTAVHPPADHFHVDHRHQLRLAAGSVAGIGTRDEFELLAYTAAVPLATAGVTRLQPFHARLEADRGHPPLPAAMIARRVRRGPVELAARLVSADLDLDRAAALARTAALVDTYRLQPPIVGDTPPGHLDLHDDLSPDGLPLAAPQLVARVDLADPRAFESLSRALARLERWAPLHDQLRHPRVGPLAGCYGLEVGRVHRDPDGTITLEPCAPSDILPAGVELGVRVRNPGRAAALHFQVFRVRADRSVEPWRDVAGGIAVLKDHQVPLTDLATPCSDLPGPQREWLVVALGDGAFDLSALATPASLLPFAVRGDDHALPCEATRVEILGVPYMLAAAT